MAKYGGVGGVAADAILFLAGALTALFFVWSFSSSSILVFPSLQLTVPENNAGSLKCSDCAHVVDYPHLDPPDPTFYDDPNLSYSLGRPIKDWDEKRKRWLDLHPSFTSGLRNRVLIVTGSQSEPCKNPIGDHLLLRAFKNKVDYCRIHHGYDIFYSNSLLHPKMGFYWTKLPVVRAAMLAHPEVEWIWWVDSDAVITDMEFEMPFERYGNYNLVAYGWESLIYEKQSWTALNAGVFLIRNCQWSMDLIDIWAAMGPISPDYEKWGEIQRSVFKDKLFPQSDDQTGLIYLLYKHKERYFDKVYLELEYAFQGYWIDVIKDFENVTRRYMEMDRVDPILRRRHAEVVSQWYGDYRGKKYLNGTTASGGRRRRPFMTHFTGCQPCSGNHNPMYTGDSCWEEMIRALNFADNQVIKKYGFTHADLLKSSPVYPLAF